MSESSYYGNHRPEVAPFLPDGARRILEIGCGKGAFRANFGSDVEYWGVEPHRQSAVIASGRLSRVLLGGLFEVEDSLPDQYFDLIVCNDVIEHIADTNALMGLLRRKLTDQGVLAGSIPNVRQSENLYKLLIDRNWKYQSSGVLDHTHLRFFTQNSIRDLFAEHGFTLDLLAGINLDLPWENAAKPLVRAFWTRFLGQDSRPLQYGFRATKRALPAVDRFFGQTLRQLSHELCSPSCVKSDLLTDEDRVALDRTSLIGADERAAFRVYHGFCCVCERHQHLLFRPVNIGTAGALRDELICVGCGLPSWARLAYALTMQLVDERSSPRVFLAEQVTQLAGALELKVPRLVSRQTRDQAQWSDAIAQGLVVTEDLQNLSFGAESLDVIGWFDATPPRAELSNILSESYRVLVGGGVLLAAGNWGQHRLLQAQMEVLSVPEEGEVPPVGEDAGSAGFIDIVRACRRLGFSSVRMRTFWSSDLALLGDDLVFLEVVK